MQRRLWLLPLSIFVIFHATSSRFSALHAAALLEESEERLAFRPDQSNESRSAQLRNMMRLSVQAKKLENHDSR